MSEHPESKVGASGHASVPRIAAVPYQPAQPPGHRGGGRWPARSWIALGALGVFALVALVFFVLARSVQVRVDPQSATLDLDGGIGFAMGSGFLLLPGDYRLRATAEGHHPLEAGFTVGPAREQRFEYSMKRLPGRLRLVSTPAAEVFIDGNARGSTPLEALELPAGEYALMLRAPRCQAYEARLQIEGGGVEQTLLVQLEPGWAPVSLRSQPPGATILIDGVESGVTPQTVEVGAGAHEISLSLAGYAPWKDRINLTAGEALALPEIRLEPARGRLRVVSTPAGAAVSVGERFAGNTPLDLLLEPGREHRLSLSAPGHQTLQRDYRIAANSDERLELRLQPILGTVRLEVQPADARVSIDGKPLAAGTRELQLTAVAHRIQASRDGYQDWTGSVTPRPGFEQRVQVHLLSNAAAAAARNPARITSAGGPELVLIQPGRLTLGSARGTQGRQANEALRPVRLTRAFYLGTTEVSNAQYRRYAAAHSSGIIRRSTLDNDRQPAARVSWEDAVRYCNWLSKQDGLTPAYERRDEGFALVRPYTTGYRLPSEAEWAWAARYAGGKNPLRYPWGAAFPPPAGAGNFADTSAEGIAGQVLDGYTDGHPAASPVGSFKPNALGLFDLGGNVAEWVHDAHVTALAIDPKEVDDPFGPDGGSARVIRGSSWMHGSLVELRLAYRDFGSQPRPDLGFRVARYAQ